MAAGGGAGIPLPHVFSPTDEELIRYYSPNGYIGMIGIVPFVGDMYILRPENITVQGSGRINEEVDDGLLTITTEWLVVTYKSTWNVNVVSGGVWVPDQRLVPITDERDNQIIGNNKIIRYYEVGQPRNLWAAIEVVPIRDQAQMVACKLIRKVVLPFFSMIERDAALTFDELIEGNFDHGDE